MIDVPMFEVPDTPPRRSPRSTSTLAHHKPRWSRYRPKNPLKCDDCMAVLHETGGHGTVALQARWARGTGDARRLLCGPHAQTQREKDKLPPLTDKPAKEQP